MIILNASMIIGKTPQQTGGANSGATTATSTAPRDEIGDLSVQANGIRKETARQLASGADLRQVKVREGGDGGLKLFLLKIAQIAAKDPRESIVYQTGKQVNPESKREPFIVKRNSTGEITISVDSDAEKLLRRYRGFAIVDSNRTRILSEGVVEGNTVTFPKSQDIPGSARIVRISQGVIGSALSSVEKSTIGTHLVESLTSRVVWTRLSDSLQAGAAKEAAAKTHIVTKNAALKES
jgi:hypothetical protein